MSDYEFTETERQALNRIFEHIEEEVGDAPDAGEMPVHISDNGPTPYDS